MENNTELNTENIVEKVEVTAVTDDFKKKFEEEQARTAKLQAELEESRTALLSEEEQKQKKQMEKDNELAALKSERERYEKETTELMKEVDEIVLGLSEVQKDLYNTLITDDTSATKKLSVAMKIRKIQQEKSGITASNTRVGGFSGKKNENENSAELNDPEFVNLCAAFGNNPESVLKRRRIIQEQKSAGLISMAGKQAIAEITGSI